MRKLTVSDSSNVRSVTYLDLQAEQSGPIDGALDVEFTSGATYRYLRCSLDDFASACHAPSVGSWVQAALVKRPKEHPCTRLSPPAKGPPSPDELCRYTLQAMASLRSDEPSAARLIDLARQVVEGRKPPAPPSGFGVPRVTGLGPPTGGSVVTWPDPDHPGNWLPPMTPDEAEGVAHALLAAAVEARL